MVSKLYKAVFAADVAEVKARLAAGDYPNERGRDRETPLMAAAREGYVQIMEVLLEKGADTSLRDEFGKTALIHAFLGNQEAAVRLLLANGAAFDLDAVLHIACDWVRHKRPSELVNVPDLREALCRIAEANGIQIGRPWTSRTLEYRRFPDGDREVVLTISLHLPEPMPKKAPPLFVFIHGGAWITGSAGDEPVWLVTQLGFAAASIEYRLAQQAAFPEPIKDCKAAIRFLRSHAWEYGYDPERIGVMGNSAGGHLALLLGLTPDDPVLDRDSGDSNVSSKVAAVCSMNGPADLMAYIRILELLDQAAREQDGKKRRLIVKELLRKPFVKFAMDQMDFIKGPLKILGKVARALLESGNPLEFEALRKSVMKIVSDTYFCGQSPLGQEALLETIDPLLQAKRIPEMPPEQREKIASFFLAYGKEDIIVPANGGVDLGIALDEAGIPNEYHELPNAGHDTSGLLPAAFEFLMEKLAKENP